MSTDPILSANPLCRGCTPPPRTRRGFLRETGLGFGWLALAGLLPRWTGAAPPLAPRAKHVIFLFMDGGVSHVDTFDPKPELTKRHGQPAQWRADARSQSIRPRASG